MGGGLRGGDGLVCTLGAQSSSWGYSGSGSGSGICTEQN